MQEELISREALLVDITAEQRFAELKEDIQASLLLTKVIRIIKEQKMMGMVNPTQFIFYGGDRE